MSDEQIMAAVRRVLTPEILGEGVHTALRKCEGGHHAHRAINAMPDDQWHRAMAFVAVGLIKYIEDDIAREAPAHTGTERSESGNA